jgi:hypothetical protein
MRHPQTTLRAGVNRSLGPLLLAIASALPTVAEPAVQAGAGGRPDQVIWVNRRGSASTLTGTVVQNDLDKVVVETGDRKREFDSSDVQRITFGTVTANFIDGTAYFDRGDFENAAAKFRLAATEGSARDVVKAAARLRAVESLMRLGATDASAFGQAREEADKFLSNHASSRDVPQARMLQARATRLAGDAAGGGALYRALYKEGAAEPPTTGYPRLLCYQAGLRAARALLDAGDTLQAREIYAEMETALPRLLADEAEGTPERTALLAVQAQARLGEGYCLLASGSTGQGRTFFQGQVNNADPSDPALRYGARLGYAEALLAESKFREAQLEFAFVAAIDHTDRDRAARALVGLAESSSRLPDTDTRLKVRKWLEDVTTRYGDTPAALTAREMLRNL